MPDRLLRPLLGRVWPTRSVDSLLRAALLADQSAAAAAWRAFEAAADFDRLTPGEMRLIGLVAKRLEALAPASPMRGRIGGIERANWSRSQLAIAETGHGLRALEAKGLSMLVIKGASRVAAADSSTRGLATSDVDLVVPPGDFEKAVDLLTEAGWHLTGSERAIDDRARLRDALDVPLAHGRFGRLHLHRSAFRHPHASETEDALMWQRSAPGRIAGARARVPCATDAVAIALAHGALDGRESGDWLADVAASIDRGVSWELFEAVAEGRRLHDRGALALRYVRERLERPVPESLLRTLEGRVTRPPFLVLASLAWPHASASGVGLQRAIRAVARQGRVRLARFRSDRRSSVAGPGRHGVRRMARYYLLRSVASPIRFLRSLFPRWTALGELATRLSFVRSAYGPYLLNRPGDRTFELCVRGYGPFVADAIASQDRPFVFLDVGANIGLFSLLAARNPRCERVLALEPLPDVFGNLRANIDRNGAAKIEPILGAVGATAAADVYLLFDPRHSGMSKIVERQHGSVRAPVISAEMLDRLFPTPPSTVVAKIDVEGSEVDVLSTLRRTHFYSAIAEMIIEVSKRNLGSVKQGLLLEMLAQDGYEEVSRSGDPAHYDARYRRVRRDDGRAR